MTVEELKALQPTEVIDLLKQSSSSTYKIAEALEGVSQTSVSQIINKKYNGSEATIERVWNHIAMTLKSREDLNPLIYDDADIFLQLLSIGIKHKNFDDRATSKFITTKEIIQKSIQQ